MAGLAIAERTDREVPVVVDELVVARQDAASRGYRVVGRLREHADGRFVFGYTRAEVERDDFEPLLGYEDPARLYVTPALPPLFAQRVINARRPDRATYLERLGLPDEAGPMEIMGRSEGRRQGDLLQLVRPPRASADGRLEHRFLVHGVRHVDPLRERLEALAPGAELTLEEEPDNPSDPRALLVVAETGRLGYVPRFLVEDVRQVLPHARRVVLEKINGKEVPVHQAALVRLTGHVPAGTTSALDREQYALAAEK